MDLINLLPDNTVPYPIFLLVKLKKILKKKVMVSNLKKKLSGLKAKDLKKKCYRNCLVFF